MLPRVRQRLATVLARFGELYPPARFPAVTIAVGRGKPVAVGGPETGVQIGLEALCAVEYLNADIEDRFVYVLAHEFVHMQQSSSLIDKQSPTVLEISLLEGAAEFVTELVAGEGAYSYFREMTAGRETEIETAFAADLDKTDVSDWVYNGTLEEPGDLGYWVGYRIAKAYYHHAGDKRRALREILEMTDAKKFYMTAAGIQASSYRNQHARLGCDVLVLMLHASTTHVILICSVLASKAKAVWPPRVLCRRQCIFGKLAMRNLQNLNVIIAGAGRGLGAALATGLR